MTVSPLFDDRGELHGAICLFSDLTAVKDLEEQLRLKESLAAVGELTAGIAHEFRNGLATIHGYSKLIDLEALPAAFRPYVEGIRAETESLTQVVTNFLNFARPAQLTLSRVDLRAVCERAADEIRADARALGGDVEVRGQFGALEGDEVLLRQAFLEPAAQRRRGVRRRVDGAGHRGRVGGLPAQKISRISVNDSGPGVAPAARAHLPAVLHVQADRHRPRVWRWCRRSSSFTTGASSSGPSPQGGASFQVTLPLGIEPGREDPRHRRRSVVDRWRETLPPSSRSHTISRTIARMRSWTAELHSRLPQWIAASR